MEGVATTVTFGVIALNEKKYLPELLENLLSQTYEKNLIEVVLVDGESEDGTEQLMQEFKEKHEAEFLAIKVLKNPKRVQPAGWNVVIANASADVLLRIDAHARIPQDFIEKNMQCINSGESVCGGPRENIIDDNSSWKQVLLLAEQSMFGAGVASYRKDSSQRKYVKSVFHGAYRIDVIRKVGLFNEELLRTEDNEYHFRVRKEGYRICYDPSIKSYYQTRNSLKRMLKQKYANGFWVGKTTCRCPGCISLFHLVPFAFVLAIILSTLFAVLGCPCIAVALWSVYGIATLLMTLLAVCSMKKKHALVVLLPIVFLLLHLSYGVGTFVGILRR